MYEFLTIEQVVKLHEEHLALTGGLIGIKDFGALESAMAQPQSGFNGQYFHPDVFEMAAAYAFHIAMNHPFNDANKRTGLAACFVFLDLNGWEVDPPSPKLFEDAVVDIVDGKLTKRDFADLLRKHSKVLRVETEGE